MSETPTTSLYTALLAFQRAVGPVKKDASNPAFRTKYATLQSVLETVEDPLSDNGLVLLQRFEPGGDWPLLITEIVHAATGDRITSTVPVVSKDAHDPQKVGGAITYYRRYSLLALLGLAPEDDDGNAAAKPAARPQPPARPASQHPAVQAAAGLEAIDIVLADMRDMDEARTPFPHIKQFADAQLQRFDEVTGERIKAKLRDIANKRKAAPQPPASFAG